MSHSGLILRWAVLAGTCVALGGCSNSEGSGTLSGTTGKSMEVTRATWHDGAWPFTVPRGILGCTKPPYPGEVTFNVDGKIYGVNGTALDQGLPGVEPIWRADGSEGLKVSVGELIERGLQLCEESR
jgi:hypothetical protein